jgi:hypothetical protein
MKCSHCQVHVQLLKSVEGPDEWVHVEPGDPPYMFCKISRAESDTIGNWAGRVLGPIK